MQSLPKVLTCRVAEVCTMLKSKPVKNDYSNLPPLDLFLLHSDLMSLTLKTVGTPEDVEYLVLHAYSHCRDWFLGGVMCLKEVAHQELGSRMLPYVHMFGNHFFSPQPCLLCPKQACGMFRSAGTTRRHEQACHQDEMLACLWGLLHQRGHGIAQAAQF